MHQVGRAQVNVHSSTRGRCLGRRAASASLLANPRHRPSTEDNFLGWARPLSNRELRNTTASSALPSRRFCIAHIVERVVHIN